MINLEAPQLPPAAPQPPSPVRRHAGLGVTAAVLALCGASTIGQELTTRPATMAAVLGDRLVNTAGDTWAAGLQPAGPPTTALPGPATARVTTPPLLPTAPATTVATTVPVATTAPAATTVPATTGPALIEVPGTTTTPLRIFVLGDHCWPLGASALTDKGTPIMCTRLDPQGKAYDDAMARWRRI